MWSYRHLVPVLLLIFVVEVLFSTERVLEEAYLGEVMGYAEMVSVRLDGAVLAGSVAGCVFAWWWMHVRRRGGFGVAGRGDAPGGGRWRGACVGLGGPGRRGAGRR